PSRNPVGVQECRLCANLERKPTAGKRIGSAALFYGGEQRGPVRGRVQRRDQGARCCPRCNTDGFSGQPPKRNSRAGSKKSPAGDVLSGQFCRKRRLDVLWRGSSRPLQTRRRFHRKDSQGKQTCRPARGAANEVRVHRQSQNSKANRIDDTAECAGAGGSGNTVKQLTRSNSSKCSSRSNRLETKQRSHEMTNPSDRAIR